MNIRGILVKTEVVELRGVANAQNKNGGVYYLINVEKEDGTPLQFFCKDASAFEGGLKKGDKVEVWCDQTEYKQQINQRVVKVHKVA